MAILTLTIPGVGDYDYDTSTTGIPGQRQDLRAIQSFNILANDAGDEWTLYVNNQIFIGRYATQAQAIGALFGCFIRAGADEVGLAAAMGNQINAGLSVITDDGDNILSQSMANGLFEGRLRNFKEQSFVGTTTKPNFGTNSLSINNTPTVIAAGSQNLTVTARAEYGSSNTFFINTKVAATLNAIVLTPIVVPALSVNVSLPTAVPVVGQPYTASAALTNYDSRIPVKYKWTWLTGSSTVVQGPTTTSSPTNSYTPLLDNTAYKAKVEMLYEYDSTDISGATDQETSSPSETTFAWTTSFPITNIGSTYTVAPVAGTNYVGSNVTLAYSWFKDGAAFGTNSASQVLTAAGTYTCDVAGSNVINGITYSGTMAASNSAIVVPSTNPLMAVSSEGWDTSLTMPGSITSGANPNFDFTKSAITVQRAGFTSAGVADTKTLTHSLTNTVRLAYPNQADKDTVNGFGTYTARTSMSDSIYSTDTVSATSTANFDSTGDAYTFDVTNNSTLGTANVIANWVTPIADFEHTNTLSIDLMAFHASATGGDMGIACVKFFAYKNGSATASYTSTVTTPTTTTASRTGIKYPVFRFTQDISSDAAGDSYRIKAEVYPVWGAMFSSEGDETATYDITSKKRIVNTNHFYDCLRWKDTNDGTIPIMYVAYAGSDATGAGTSANPYATIKRAKEQIFTNTSGYGGIIHVSGALGETAVALTTAWASLGSAPTWPTKIKGDGTAILYSGVSTDGDKNIKGAPYLIIDNVTFDYANVSGTLTGTGPATGGWYTFWGNGSSSENTAPTRLMFNNCVFKNMTTAIGDYTIVYIDAIDFFNCLQDETNTKEVFFVGTTLLTGLRTNSGLLVGNKLKGTQFATYPNVYVGNAGAARIHMLACGDYTGVWLTSTLERHRNNVIGAYNLAYNTSITGPGFLTGGGDISSGAGGGTYGAGNDIALVCNYSETLVGGQATFKLSGDGDIFPINNHLIWHNTAISQRVNYIYNDSGYALKSDINIRGNLFSASYIKADLFGGGNPLNVGNWATLNGVNTKYNSTSYFNVPGGAGYSFLPDHRNDWYQDTDNAPLVLTSTPAMATRSRWDDPIGCVAGFESVVGFTYGAAESPIPILTDGTAATKLGAGIPPVGVDVTNIKLFLSADPTGIEITAPIIGVQYYAYAYNGTTLLTTSALTWSATTPASTFGVSGLLDSSFGVGAQTASPVWVLPSGGPAGSTGIGSRQDSNIGLAVLFNSTTSMNNFIAAYPNDFAQLVYRDTFNNVDVVTKPGWVWDPQVNNRAYLEIDQWLNWQPFTGAEILDQTMDWKQRVIPVGSTGWGPITSTGVAGVSGSFAAAQYTGVSIFDELGLIQINTTDASNIITFFFHTALARDEFKAFTNFTVGGTSFNPSANADWVELNAGTLGFGLQYVDSVVCPAWTDELDSGTTFGYYVGTSTFATPAQTMTWTLGGAAGAPWTNSGSVVSAVTGTEFLRPQTSEVSGGPRLVNGAEANNFGAILYAFQDNPSGNYLSGQTQCTWYWQSLDVRTSNSRRGTPPGAWTIQRAPAFTQVQASYTNISMTYGQGNIVSGPDFNGWEGGDVVDFEIRDSNYASKRLISFTLDSTAFYQPHTTIGGGTMWNFRGATNSVGQQNTLGRCTFYDSSEGSRDGKMQWLTETAQALELWDRDTNTTIPCTHSSQGSGNSSMDIFFTANALISGNRYELRYV